MEITLPRFLFTLDFWNFVIVVSALLIALYTVWYTHRKDRFSIEILECEYIRKSNRPTFISFSVFNTSNSSIKIIDIQIYDSNNNPVNVIDYEPKPEYADRFGQRISPADSMPMPWEYADPFVNSTIIPSESKVDFSYYVNPFNNPLTIHVTTNKKIQWFSKAKSFNIQFSKLN